jgi:molybdopterin biosynthesis enzyme
VAVYRNDATLARIGSMLRMVAIVGLAIGALGMTRALTESGHALTAAASSGLLAVGIVAVLLGRRARVAAVETGADGVEVRNLFSTRRFAWDEVEDFEEGTRRRGMTVAIVRTSGGKVHALSGVGDPGTTSAKIVDKLRKELRATRR